LIHRKVKVPRAATLAPILHQVAFGRTWPPRNTGRPRRRRPV